MTPKQAAYELEITTKTLKRWDDAGLIESRKMLNRRREYDPGEVERVKRIKQEEWNAIALRRALKRAARARGKRVLRVKGWPAIPGRVVPAHVARRRRNDEALAAYDARLSRIEATLDGYPMAVGALERIAAIEPDLDAGSAATIYRLRNAIVIARMALYEARGAKE